MTHPAQRADAPRELPDTLSEDARSLWPLLDGQRDPAALAAALGWSGPQAVRRVWTALDLLADHHLLTQRAAPPAAALPHPGRTGLSRREAIQRLAAGLAGGLAVAVGAREVLAQEARKVGNGASSAQEERQKEANAKDIDRWETRSKQLTADLKEAEACQREASKVNEARQKQCADPRRVREEHEKAQTHLTNARRQDANLKHAASQRLRDHSEADQKAQ